MFKNIGFGRPKAPEKNPASTDATTGGRADGESAARLQANAQREMVRIAVKETLRQHGIPAAWVGSEVRLSSSNTLNKALTIRLILQEWQEALLPYLPVLQNKILQTLKSGNPSVDSTMHTVSWAFAPDCGCPHLDLPAPASWVKLVAAQVGQRSPATFGSNPAPMRAPNAAPSSGPTPTAAPATLPATAPAKPKFELAPSELDRAKASDWDAIPSEFAASLSFENTRPSGPEFHRP